MPIDMPCIGFSATKGVLSRFLRWVADAPFSHAWFEYTHAQLGGRWVLLASHVGIVTLPFEHAAHNWTNIYRFVLVDGDLTPALRTATRLAGDRYGFPTAGVRGLCQRLFRRRTRVCSEFVAAGLVSLRLPGTETWKEDALDPTFLGLYCTTHPDLFKHVLL